MASAIKARRAPIGQLIEFAPPLICLFRLRRFLARKYLLSKKKFQCKVRTIHLLEFLCRLFNMATQEVGTDLAINLVVLVDSVDVGDPLPT